MEVDTRKVEGTGDTVSLYLTNLGAGTVCAVIVRDADGTDVSRFDYADRGEALAHYRHTFAYAGGPGIPSDTDQGAQLAEPREPADIVDAFRAGS